MKGVPYYTQRASKGMVQQTNPQHCPHLQRIERTLRHPLYWGQRYKKSLVSLLNIKQREDKSLRSYVTRFNKEAILIDEADDKVPVTAFTNWLQSGEFIFSIYKNDSKTMANMLYKATKYMNVEDAMIV